MIPWWVVASLMSNASIIVIEYLNREAQGGWATVLPQTAPLIIAAQFCLFFAFRDAPSWMLAWAVFSLGNSVMRVGAVHFLARGEIGSWNATIAGILVMTAGAFIVKTGIK